MNTTASNLIDILNENSLILEEVNQVLPEITSLNVALSTNNAVIINRDEKELKLFSLTCRFNELITSLKTI